MALSDRIWWTKKSRIQTEKRLLHNAFQAQLLLLWYSFFSVGMAVYYLKFNTSSEYSSVAWVVFSVLTLSISVFINGLGFKERASLIKGGYEALHELYRRAKSAEQENSNVENIGVEYEKILNACENHLDIDYHLALCKAYLTDSNDGLDRRPTKYSWAQLFFYYLKRWLLLPMLYILPFLLFWMMEFGSVLTKTV